MTAVQRGASLLHERKDVSCCSLKSVLHAQQQRTRYHTFICQRVFSVFHFFPPSQAKQNIALSNPIKYFFNEKCSTALLKYI